MITIVIADDHQIVRQGVKALLAAEVDFRVIGEAGDGLEAVRLVKSLNPDILVVDLKMPGLTGLEVIEQSRQDSTKTGFVVLSMYGTKPYVVRAFELGAAGYVLKESSACELVCAVREVAAGRKYLSPSISEESGENPKDSLDYLDAEAK